MGKGTMNLMCVCAAVLIAMGMQQLAIAATVDETNVPEVVVRLKESIRGNWDKLSDRCEQVATLREEMEGLPESAWFHPDKKYYRARIRKQIMTIRTLLLSTNAQALMKSVDKLAARIADVDKDIHKERAKGVFCSAKSDKKNSTLSKLREKRRNLVSQREEALREVLKDLDALGLRLSGDAAEQCLSMVDSCDLIDAVVVAKSIGIVVENLRMLMATGDVAAAKRYFGIYVVMVEVQKACFDEYLDRSLNGEWREKLIQIEVDASDMRKKALKSARDRSFNENQRAAFKRNAEVNEATLNAVGAYKKILGQHIDVIRAKSNEAAKMLLVAENSYLTVSLTDEFLTLIKANQDSFEALLQLDLPPIEIFNDTALQAEFVELTRRLESNGKK